MDNELSKWIDRADDYKRKHGTEMVVIFRAGIYENWPADVFDKCGGPEDVVYRTDGKMEPEVSRTTIHEYAKKVYEKKGE